ncbi:5128_t:CDS:2, partial [Entrophospora sp. SA101]
MQIHLHFEAQISTLGLVSDFTFRLRNDLMSNITSSKPDIPTQLTIDLFFIN